MSVRKPPLVAALAAYIAAGFLVGPVIADDQYDKCLNEKTSNADWMVCGVDYLDRLDGQLNEAWLYVFPELTDEGKAQLRTEQRAWIKFKDSSCFYYLGSDYGREGEVLHFPICQGQIIEQRIDYLNQLGDFTTGEGE